MSSTETKLKEIVGQMQAARERMRKEGQDALSEAFKEFFRSHPEVESIMWSQYTPWFNDGDACTFRVNEWELRVDPANLSELVKERYTQYAEDDGTYGYGDACYVEALNYAAGNGYSKPKTLHKLTPEESQLLEDYEALRNACCEEEDLLQEVMGDHCLVTVTADGISVSEYEHD